MLPTMLASYYRTEKNTSARNTMYLNGTGIPNSDHSSAGDYKVQTQLEKLKTQKAHLDEVENKMMAKIGRKSSQKNKQLNIDIKKV